MDLCEFFLGLDRTGKAGASAVCDEVGFFWKNPAIDVCLLDDEEDFFNVGV